MHLTGRPQYESFGVGYILTPHEKLSHYITRLTQQLPIESQFIASMVDNLNAEISLGTVTSVDEAVTWLSYTYLYIRMKRNPFGYGMPLDEPAIDPLLGRKRRELIVSAATQLAKNNMIIYEENSGMLSSKDLGRIAAAYYVKHTSIELFNGRLNPRNTEADILALLSSSCEFENLKVRDEEMTELKQLMEYNCVCEVKVFIQLINHLGLWLFIVTTHDRVVLKTTMEKQIYCSKL
jgi:replicative superfamily II helicase